MTHAPKLLSEDHYPEKDIPEEPEPKVTTVSKGPTMTELQQTVIKEACKVFMSGEENPDLAKLKAAVEAFWNAAVDRALAK